MVNIENECMQKLNQLFESMKPPQKSNVALLSTFNVWGVPFGSHEIFTRSQKWRKFNDEQIFSLLSYYYDSKSTTNEIENKHHYTLHSDFLHKCDAFKLQNNNVSNSNDNNINNNIGDNSNTLETKKNIEIDCKSNEIASNTEALNMNDMNNGEIECENDCQVPLIISCFQEAFSFVNDRSLDKYKHGKHQNDKYSKSQEKSMLVTSIVTAAFTKTPRFNKKKDKIDFRKHQTVASLNYSKSWRFSSICCVSSSNLSNSNSNNNNSNNAVETHSSSLDIKLTTTRTRIPDLPKENKKIWDAPRQIFDSAGKVPFIYVIGSNGLTMHQARSVLIDSGLCMLSTWIPFDFGFKKYKNRPSLSITDLAHTNPEICCNKGALWAYFRNNETSVGTLIFTTHLSTDMPIKTAQLEELGALMNTKKETFENETDYLEVFLAGDFNLDLSQKPLKEFKEKMQLKSLISGEPTNGSLKRAIDHIFTWRKEMDIDNIDNNDRQKRMENVLIDMINHKPIISWKVENKNEENMDLNEIEMDQNESKISNVKEMKENKNEKKKKKKKKNKSLINVNVNKLFGTKNNKKKQKNQKDETKNQQSNSQKCRKKRGDLSDHCWQGVMFVEPNGYA